MRTHARAVVIGGGVVGVSTLYHLARKGWSDSVLVERRELTSGSTWHAAGLLPLFNLSYSVGQIHKYSVALYRTLENETGLDVGLRQVSNIRLARTRDRMDEYHYYAGVAATIGVKVKFLTPQEVKEIWPLCNVEGILGAIQHPEDGYIQPADLTQALARAARERGAEINRHTTVIAIERRPSGEWKVATDKGDIVCEHVVSATGNFARATGRMVGINVPVIPVQHQYIVTEAHPEILARKAKGLPEMGVLRESNSSWYMREEAGGLLLGPYEKGAPACYVDGPSADSEYELFPEDLDRLAPHIETAIARVPAFGEAGVKKVYNGAIAYTPDGSPIVGPAPGLKNFWLNEGHSFGVTAAGGAGWQLAEWIVDGEPTIDMLGVDPRRFGALRRDRVSHREERGGLRQGLHRALSRRRARRRAPAAPDALLCADEGSRRRVRLDLRLGAAELVRTAWLRSERSRPRQARRALERESSGRRPRREAARKVELPPFELFRLRRRRVPERARQCRPAGHVGLRQARGFRSWRRRLAELDPYQPHPQVGRPRHAHLSAHLARRRARRVHADPDRAGAVLSGLGRRAGSPRFRHDGEAAPRRHAACGSTRSRRSAASSCSPGRGRARCWRRSPTSTSRTKRSHG